MSRLIVHTGKGRGKTTAALGIVLRAVGHGKRAAVVHFQKSKVSGEHEPLEKLGVSLQLSGRGFTPAADSPAFPEHKKAAEQGMAQAEKWLSEGVECLVLDEICGAIHAGLVDELQVLDVLSQIGEQQVVVCTGRYASSALIDLADTVSDIANTKHAMVADEGVEL